MSRTLAFACIAIVLSTAIPVRAQADRPAADLTPAEAAAQDLIAQEQLRSSVAAALRLQGRDGRSGVEKIENFSRAALDLLETGVDAVPYLVLELEQEFPSTYYFSAYALGLIGSPEAETALRASVERTNGADGDLALMRKAWACFGLALMGRADAVDLLDQGRHKAGKLSMHASTSALEIAAIQTFPQSVPLLISQLTRYAEDEELDLERSYTIKALGRVGAPEALSALLEMPGNSPRLRRDVMVALENIDTPEALAALIEGLEDEDLRVRKTAAISLERRWPADHIGALTARLEKEDNPVARGSLYLALAHVAGRQAIPTLRKHWGRPESIDRLYLQRALRHVADASALDLIQAGLIDQDLGVASPAVQSLVGLETKPSRQLVHELLGSRVWPVVQLIVEQVVERGDRSLAPHIAERLFSRELAEPVTDPRLRDPIRVMAEGLVKMRHHESLDSFREAGGRQPDAQVRNYLKSVAARLEAIRENGKKVDKWVKTLSVGDAEMRRVAYEVLGEIGTGEASEALSRSFGRVEPGEGAIILRSLGQIDTPTSRELIARVLTDPQFETLERLALRDMAAWSARQLGGADLVQAVKSAVEQRQGREVRLLIYLALMDPAVALPVLDAHAAERMRFIGWSRGKEHRELEWVRRELRAGRSIDRLDLPPDLISFR